MNSASCRKSLDNPQMRKLLSDFTASRGMVTIGLLVNDQQMIAFKSPVTIDFSSTCSRGG